MSSSASGRGAAADRAGERAPAAQLVGHRVKAHRRELMEGEFERIALDLFAERGYGNVSVEDIAEEAGVTARTFYRYFAAKEDVLARYPRRLSDLVRDALETEPADRPVFDALSAVLIRLVASIDLAELRRWCSAMGSDPHSHRSMALSQFDLRQDIEPRLAQRFAGQSSDALQFDLALSACQIAMSAATTTWFTGGGDLETLLQRALQLFARGFSNVGAA